MHHRTLIASAVAGLTIAVLPALPAQAAPVTLTFSGTTANGAMTVNNGTNTGSIPADTPYTGSVTYDPTSTATVGYYGGGLRNRYPFADLTFTVGSSTVHLGPGTIDVLDNVQTGSAYPSGDSLYVNFTGATKPDGLLAGADFNWIGLGFVDASGTAISNGQLPADLAAVAWTDMFSEFNFGSQGSANGGTTTALQPLSLTATGAGTGTGTGTTPAPEPCQGSDGVVTAFVPRKPGYLKVNGGTTLLDHLWTTDLNPGNTTFLGGTTTFYQYGVIVDWVGDAAADGCHLTALTVRPPVRFATAALAAGQVGSAYSSPVAAEWGVAPYAVSVSNLPAGLSFDGSSISGTPTAAGTFTVVGSVVDGVGASATTSWTLDVAAAPAPVVSGPVRRGLGFISEVGTDHLVVGGVRLVWDAASEIEVHTLRGERHVIDGSVRVGRIAVWSGRRIAGTSTVLVTELEIY